MVLVESIMLIRIGNATSMLLTNISGIKYEEMGMDCL